MNSEGIENVTLRGMRRAGAPDRHGARLPIMPAWKNSGAAARRRTPGKMTVWARSGAWPPRAQTARARVSTLSLSIMPLDS